MALKYIIPIVALIAGAFVAGVKKENDSNQVLAAERSAEEAVEKLRTANEDNRKQIERIRRNLKNTIRSSLPKREQRQLCLRSHPC